ncbi:hypothetical protein GF312_16740 [Candidatus Poribacteria bacterium]|nr:hypothetical protein [Candidatus Poribacteria bacterium]
MKLHFSLAVIFIIVSCMSTNAVEISLPTLEAAPGDALVVEMVIDEAEGIAGGDLSINYDPAILELVGDPRATNLMTGLLVQWNTGIPGEISAAMAGSAGLDPGSGTMFEFDFQVKADAAGTSELAFSDVFLFDENIDDIDVTTVDGSVTVTSAAPEPKNLTISDATVNAGDQFTVTVDIDEAEGVTGADLVILYGENMLSVVEVTATGLLPGTPVINDSEPGRISISMASVTGADAGSGAIFNISFTAVQGMTDDTEITFESADLYDEDEDVNNIPVNTSGAMIKINGPAVSATGTLTKFELTTFMYGTHGLIVDGALAYALESSTLELDQFIDQKVIVNGIQQHGGLDGGPPLVNVASVEVVTPAGPEVVKEHTPGDAMLALQASYDQANVHGHTYIDIWTGEIVVESGMFLEFQVAMFSGNPTFKGTVDLHTSDGSSLRDSGAVDQNDLSAHPATDLSQYARDMWYHRKISLEPLVGKTIDGVMIATDSNEHMNGVFRVYVDNIQITDGEYVLNYIWGDEATQNSIPINGQTTATETNFAGTQGMSDYAVTIVGETPVTPAEKLFSTWGSIKKSD